MVHVSTCTVSHCVRSTVVCSYSVVSLCSFRVHLSSTVRASLRLHCVPSTVLFPSGRVHLLSTVRIFTATHCAGVSVRTVYSACLYGNTLCSSTAVFLLVFSVRTVYSACLYGNTLLCIMRCGLGPCRLQCVRVFATTHCVPSTALFLLGPSVRVTCRLQWSLRHTAFRLLRCHSLASLQPLLKHGIC